MSPVLQAAVGQPRMPTDPLKRCFCDSAYLYLISCCLVKKWCIGSIGSFFCCLELIKSSWSWSLSDDLIFPNVERCPQCTWAWDGNGDRNGNVFATWSVAFVLGFIAVTLIFPQGCASFCWIAFGDPCHLTVKKFRCKKSGFTLAGLNQWIDFFLQRVCRISLFGSLLLVGALGQQSENERCGTHCVLGMLIFEAQYGCCSRTWIQPLNLLVGKPSLCSHLILPCKADELMLSFGFEMCFLALSRTGQEGKDQQLWSRFRCADQSLQFPRWKESRYKDQSTEVWQAIDAVQTGKLTTTPFPDEAGHAQK